MGGDLDDDQVGDPARAFEDLRAEVSVMRRAVEALPGTLKESLPAAPPDYRSDVGKVAQALAAVVGRLDVIEKHPAIRLTPEQHRQAIAREGNELMRDAAGRLDKATREHAQVAGQLAGIIGTMRGRRDQAFWLIALPLVAVILTLLASPVVLGELPFGWNLSAAATVMKADRWDAGWALLRAADPGDAGDAAAGYNLVQSNQAALVACQQAAAKEGKDHKCTITVKAP
ncbi:DUF6118 family protein [Acidocella facilis]|uniref:DUF6118 family protein n=1 Tax=Acidocella facilis TaxID=525 RepID=UPI001F2412A1|nr:DUF6118 family protein [Acidocella facilis]